MKRLVFLLLWLATFVSASHAQAPSPAQMGIDRSAVPEVLQVLDRNKQWTGIGKLDNQLFSPNGTGTIYATSVGMAPGYAVDPATGNPWDNSVYLNALLAASGPGNTVAPPSSKVVFPMLPGHGGPNGSLYRFSRPLAWSRSSEIACDASAFWQQGVWLVFDPGIDGVVAEQPNFSTDGTAAAFGGWGQALTGCKVVSLGYGSATATHGSNSVASVVMTGPYDDIPATQWKVGDGFFNIGFLYRQSIAWTSSAYNTAVTISGTTLTTTGFMTGAICVGSDVIGYNVPNGTKIQALPNGNTRANGNSTNQCSMANGAYTLNQPAPIPVSQPMYFLQPSVSTNAGAYVTGVSTDGATLTLDQNVFIPWIKGTPNQPAVDTDVKHAIFRLPQELTYSVNTWGQQKITATAAWNKGDTQIPVSSCAGIIYDQVALDLAISGASQIGTVGYCDPTAKILYFKLNSTGALVASNGANDDIWVAGSNIGQVTGGPNILLTSSDPLWSDAFRFGWTVSSAWNTVPMTVTAYTPGSTQVTVGQSCPAAGALGHPAAHLWDATTHQFVAHALSGTTALPACVNLPGGGAILNMTVRTPAPLTVGDVLGAPVQSNKAVISGDLTLAQAGASQFFTVSAANMYAINNNLIPNAYGATVTHTGGSGKLWRLPTGYNKHGSARTYNDTFTQFPVGLKNNPSTGTIGAGSGATTQWDNQNWFELDAIGRWAGGNNAGASTSYANLYGKNFLTDIAEFGTVGSLYLGDNPNSYENGEAPRSLIGCGGGIIGASIFVGMYVPNNAYTTCTVTGIGSLDQTVVANGQTPTLGQFYSMLAGAPADAQSITSAQASDGWTVYGLKQCMLGATGATAGGGTVVAIDPNQTRCATYMGMVLNDLTSPVIAPNTTITAIAPSGVGSPTANSLTLSNPIGTALFNGTTTTGSNTLTVASSPAPWGNVCVGDPVQGAGLNSGATIAGLSTGDTTAGHCEKVVVVGTYTLNASQTTGVGPIQIVDTVQGIVTGDTLLETGPVSALTGPCVRIGAGLGTVPTWEGISLSRLCANPLFVNFGIDPFDNAWGIGGGNTNYEGTFIKFPLSDWTGSAQAISKANLPNGFTIGDMNHTTTPAGYERSLLGYSVLPPAVTNHLLGDVIFNLSPTPGGTSQLVMGRAFSTTLAGAVTKGSTTSVPVAACPSPALPAGALINDITPIPVVQLGTLSSCSGTTLTFQAAAANSGASGDSIGFNQWYPAGAISGDAGGIAWPIGKTSTIANLPICPGSVAGMSAVITNGVAAPTYLQAVSATGSSTRKVFCDTTGWLYD